MPLEGPNRLSMIYGLNHFSIDKPLQDVLLYFMGRVPDLYSLGDYAGTVIYEAAYHVDRRGRPVHVMYDIRGDRADISWLDPLERRVVEDLMLKYGLNRAPFVGGSWHEHYAGINLVGDPGLACIFTITIQTAYALWKYGTGKVRDYYRNLAGINEPLMLGATWFTEIQGGSDLGANITTASSKNNKWVLNGYKYLASGAGLADVALATARIPGSRPGAKGLSLFAVPRLREDGSLNFYVRRLKDKSGTVSVPTGEVELVDSEAYLLGEADKGIYYTLEDLMISRISNSAGAVGISRKAYLEAYHYSLHRKAFGKRIIDHRLVRRDLLEMEVLTLESLILTHKAIDLFEKSMDQTPPYNENYHYARLITHIAKNLTAANAARVTMLAMELFGGIGFLSEYMIERWHREALITPIWEGTSNIQALDMLEAIYRKKAHGPFLGEAEFLSKEAYSPELAQKAKDYLEETIKNILVEDPESVEFNAKYILEDIGHAYAVLLLENMAEKLRKPVYHHIADIILNSILVRKPIYYPGSLVLEDIITLQGSLPL